MRSTPGRTPRRLRLAAVTVLAASLLLGACGGSDGDDADGGSGGEALVIYSGRSEALVSDVIEKFTEDTGIEVRVQYADTSELTPTLLEEGENSPADVFFSQDAGALAALANEGLLDELPASVLDTVDERFRDPEGRWVGVTGRARVVAYNTGAVDRADLPASVFDVTDPKWKGRVGVAPTNASFVAFVSALIESEGEERTKEFLEALQANDPKRYDNNVLALRGVAAGEVDLALINHYYLYNERKDSPDVPVDNHYTGQADGAEGTFVNVAGAAVLASSERTEDAQRFVEYLVGADAQNYFRDETSEYPLRTGIDPVSALPPLSSLRTIDVPLANLGRDLRASTELLKEVGLT